MLAWRVSPVVSVGQWKSRCSLGVGALSLPVPLYPAVLGVTLLARCDETRVAGKTKGLGLTLVSVGRVWMCGRGYLCIVLLLAPVYRRCQALFGGGQMFAKRLKFSGFPVVPYDVREV